jgi:hypothetical protein
MSEEQIEGVWVVSDVTTEGSSMYTVTVHAGPDTALTLKADAAVRYVAAVYRAAVIAQHDAAVIQQLLSLGCEEQAAASAVVDMREDREPLAVEATVPLRFEPIVAADGFKPFVIVSVRNKRVSQWTPEDCFQHGSQVMQVLAGVDLDAAYYRYLRFTVGLDERGARVAVHKLGAFAGLADDGETRREPV